MDGREDQVILIEQRRAGLVRARRGRVEREVGEELLARAIAGGDLLELRQIGGAHRRIVVQPFKMRLGPAAGLLQPTRPWRSQAEKRESCAGWGAPTAGSSCSRSRCGWYQGRTCSNSAGHGDARRNSASNSVTKSFHSAPARGGVYVTSIAAGSGAASRSRTRAA